MKEPRLPLGKFKCPSCNNDTFRVEERRVGRRTDSYIESQIICGKCAKNQNASIINTGSLKLVK